jgi:tetratricopeptide (TPR) repeat protein
VAEAHLSSEKMDGLLNDNLSPSELADADAHVRGCRDCRSKLEQLTATIPTVAALGRPPARLSSSLSTAPPGLERLEVIGEGKTATVYRAWQPRLKRVVALKVLTGGWSSEEEAQRRFQTEFQAAAKLNHPHIVQVHEVGTHENRPFFVMEYCAGGSLAKRLKDGPLPPRQAAEILKNLARALDRIHAGGLVHRDLKPDNILFISPLYPKIADFGVVKRLDAEEGATPVGSVLGTPPYLAPEQIDGSSPIDARGDLYALGVILYECLIGRPPFLLAFALDALFDVLSREPTPPRRIDPRIPVDLETICLKCLAKEPARRYDSALALAEDLHRFLNGLLVKARRIGALGRACRWSRRNPMPAFLAAALALSVFVGVVLCGRLWYEAVESRRETEAARREAEEHFLRTRRLLPDLVAAGAGPWPEVAERRQVRRVALERACELYRELCRSQPDDRELRGELAQVLTALGELSRSEGQYQAARERVEEAVALWKPLTEETPAEARWRTGRANSLLELAAINNFLGRSKEMNAAYRESIALFQRLTEERADDEDRLLHSAHARVSLSAALFGEGKIDESISLLEENRRRPEAYLTGNIDIPKVRVDLVEILFRLGQRYEIRGQKPGAVCCWREGRERGDGLPLVLPKDPRAWYYPAACALWLPHSEPGALTPAEALPQLEKAVRLLEASYERDPTAEGRWGFLSEVSYDLADGYIDLNRPVDSLRAERRATERMSPCLPASPLLKLVHLDGTAQRARREQKARRTETAQRYAREVADGFVAFCADHAADPALLATALDYTTRLAPPLRHAGATDQSRRLVERALRLAQELTDSNPDAANMRRLSEVWLQLAKCRMRYERDGVKAALTEAVSAARRFAAVRPENRYLLDDRLARLARFSRAK